MNVASDNSDTLDVFEFRIEEKEKFNDSKAYETQQIYDPQQLESLRLNSNLYLYIL